MSARATVTRTGLRLTMPGVVLLAVLGGATFSHAHALMAQGAHVHGEATLNIGIEGTGGQLEFRAPGDDVFGFEHEPRTAAERQARDAALALLRTRSSALVRFDTALGCTLTPTAVAVVRGAGGHGEVRAAYALACRKAPAGRPVTFGFSRAFPGIRRVRVQLVSDTTQVGVDVVQDRGVVRP